MVAVDLGAVSGCNSYAFKFDDSDIPVTIAYGAVCLFVVIAIFILYLVLYLMISCENAALDMEESYVPVSEFLQPIQPVAWYSVQVAVVADFFKITPDEVLTEYQRDVAARTWIVRHTFPRNDLTSKFLSSFRSRFLKRGYDMNALVSKTVVALSREDKKKKKKT